MKLYFFINTLLFPALTCFAQPSLSGEYKISNPDFKDRVSCFFKGIKHSVGGSELSLKKDSSFIYTTCGNIIEGKWVFENRILYLHLASNKFRNDSLNFSSELKQNINQTLEFKVKNRKLYRIDFAGNGEKYIEILSRQDTE